MLNPEFRRYLWIELSPHKLVAMPVVLVAVFALAEIMNVGLASLASIGFAVIVCFWGTRRAAAAVAEEVRGGTWDSQRLSALEAWTMSWGKLLGSTVFAWYGGLICLAVYAAASLEHLSLAAIGKYCLGVVLLALLMHATALAASLAFLRKLSGDRHVSVTLCHLIGLGVFVAANWGAQFSDMLIQDSARSIPSRLWHGVEFDAYVFMMITLLVFFGWAMLAVRRLMCAELQYRLWHWGWAAFTIFMVAFLSGYGDGGRGWTAPDVLALLGFFVAVSITYLGFLLENKNIVGLKAWISALGGGRWIAAVRLTPSWFMCLCFAVAVGFVLIGMASVAEISGPARILAWQIGSIIDANSLNWITFYVAAILFLLRDIGFLLFMNLGTRLRRPDLAGVIYLMVLYGVGGGILLKLGNLSALAFVFPIDTGNPFFTVAPILVQVVAVYALIATRLRGTMRREV